MAEFALSIPVGSWHPALPAMVRSVLQQSARPELAVFDASGDPQVARALEPLRHLSVHWHEGPDDGQAAAIQSGWDATTAPICGWLNADDVLYPDALQRASRHFSESTDVVTGQSIFMDSLNSFTGLHPGIRVMGSSIRRGNIISQPSTFVRRECVDAVGGLDGSRHYTMDWDLWVRLFDAGARFRQTDEILSAVTMENGTKTSEFTTRRRAEILSILSRHWGPLTRAKSLVGFWRRHRAEQSIEAGRSDHTYARRLLKELGEHGQLYAGVPFSRPVTIKIPNVSAVPATAVVIEANGTLAEGEGSLLPEPLPPGHLLEITLSPAAGPVLLRRLCLL